MFSKCKYSETFLGDRERFNFRNGHPGGLMDNKSWLIPNTKAGNK
jgi:hypothetical protein